MSAHWSSWCHQSVSSLNHPEMNDDNWVMAVFRKLGLQSFPQEPLCLRRPPTLPAPSQKQAFHGLIIVRASKRRSLESGHISSVINFS